ncbi:MAG: hypothetical protein IJX88_05335 [Clostridia bacterium]|nr:hypothetical protein [Clostridia bacterium]
MKKFFGFLKEHWLKFLGAAIVLLIISAIFQDNDTISIIGILGMFVAGALAIVGLVLKFLEGLAIGAQKLGNSMKKMFGGKKSSATKKVSNGRSITTLTSGSTSIDFYDFGEYTYRAAKYAVLQPVDRPEGMDANDVFVFRMNYKGNGEYSYELEPNDATVDAVLRIANNARR